jgi:acetoin utilization protein AcuB
MIVRDVMTTKLVTVQPDDTLSHAAMLFRQHQFHHLPVVKSVPVPAAQGKSSTALVLEGMITSQDIDIAAAVGKQGSSSDALNHPWHERHVVEVMHRALLRVSPLTSVAAAAQMLVERGLNYLPVVEYEPIEQETRTILVGLLTRSDLLIALARSMGAFEPGMQLEIPLPLGNMTPLAETLRIAAELHTPIRSIIAAPLASGLPQLATLRLGTINPAPLLVRLKEASIEYAFANLPTEGDNYA